MKDYKEMTESVLQQAKVRSAQQKHQRRMATGLIAASLCLAVLIAVGFAVGRDPADTTQPTLSMENPATVPATQPDTPQEATAPVQPESSEPVVPPEEVKVYFLSHTATQVSQTYFLKDVSIPVDGRIRVRRFAGLSEEERKQAILDEKADFEAHRAECANFPTGQSYVRERQSGMLSFVCNGSIYLEFKDKDQYESVDIETTEVGAVAGASVTYTKTATYGEGENQITYPAGTFLYVVFWHPSDVTENKLMSDPNMPLSAISDTITVTVNYSNGAQQTLIIDVTVDDDGQIYMTQRVEKAVV